MIQEPKNRELTREDVFAEYVSRTSTGCEHFTDDFHKKMKEANELFKGKKKLEVMIKGTVQFDKGYEKLFTFFDNTYDVEYSDEKDDQLPNVLHALDDFKAFMCGERVNYFSEIENEYVNYRRVLNAHIFFELT